jgi:hypothetical protein
MCILVLAYLYSNLMASIFFDKQIIKMSIEVREDVGIEFEQR